MATKVKRASTKKATPRYPEKKWGPFASGTGIAVWLNEFETAEGTRYARTITFAPRRFRDTKSGEWRDVAYRPVDLSAMLLAIQAALDFCNSAPLPGQAAEPEEIDLLTETEEVPANSEIPY